jgi:NAD(P)-dependent dehydrogenase (short-subunit alcohol dehydrogenase family)
MPPTGEYGSKQVKNIVITGSTRGIGCGLADAFLKLDCAVVINGRTQAGVDVALAQLSGEHGRGRVHGHPCDMAQLEQAEDLWNVAKATLGTVDIWINNAGIGHAMEPMWQLPPESVTGVVYANILGVIFGSRVAIRGMEEQGQGQVYNMLGHGAKGSIRDGMSVYGTTKAAVSYLSKALISEAKGTCVQIGTLSPGMVKTDLLVDRLKADPQTLAGNRRIFNIVTDRVETVAPWLAQRILANQKSGAHIRWLTTPKLMWRFLSAPIIKRDIFDEVL